MWISAGRFMRLANAMTFFVPSTLVRSADSSGGLNVTRPDELMSTSMSCATRWASSSLSPRFGSVMSPSTTTTFLRRTSASPSAPPCLARSGSKAGDVTTLCQNRASLSVPLPRRTMTYARPISGNRSSSMLSSTFPTNPVLPRMKRLRPRKISLTDSASAGASRAFKGSMKTGLFTVIARRCQIVPAAFATPMT